MYTDKHPGWTKSVKSQLSGGTKTTFEIYCCLRDEGLLELADTVDTVRAFLVRSPTFTEKTRHRGVILWGINNNPYVKTIKEVIANTDDMVKKTAREFTSAGHIQAWMDNNDK